jgi:hypothetical protein
MRLAAEPDIIGHLQLLSIERPREKGSDEIGLAAMFDRTLSNIMPAAPAPWPLQKPASSEAGSAPGTGISSRQVDTFRPYMFPCSSYVENLLITSGAEGKQRPPAP